MIVWTHITRMNEEGIWNYRKTLEIRWKRPISNFATESKVEADGESSLPACPHEEDSAVREVARCGLSVPTAERGNSSLLLNRWLSCFTFCQITHSSVEALLQKLVVAWVVNIWGPRVHYLVYAFRIQSAALHCIEDPFRCPRIQLSICSRIWTPTDGYDSRVRYFSV